LLVKCKVDMDRSAWLNALLENLQNFEQEGKEAVAYLQAHHTKIAIKKAGPSIGAWWTVTGNINLNSLYYSYDKPFNDTRIFTLVIHEVRHLYQGFFTALSVYGELDAWQYEWSIYHRLHGNYSHPAIDELMKLPLGWDRNVLRKAVQLMQTYATKGYRADLLPLYPLGKEIRYRLFKKVPKTTLQSA
jgi:hypothetical protein